MKETLEAEIKARFDERDLRGAATLALEGYGSELLGYLVTTAGDPSAAEEVFSMLSEDLWKGLPTFRFQSSMRTWLYVLARHAHARYQRSPHERRQRPLSEMSEVEMRVRTQTRPWLLTEVKDRFSALRDMLSPSERELLVLRIDRRMPWTDIAEVLDEHDDKAVPRLRKRFSNLKKKLHDAAREAGIVP